MRSCAVRSGAHFFRSGPVADGIWARSERRRARLRDTATQRTGRPPSTRDIGKVASGDPPPSSWCCWSRNRAVSGKLFRITPGSPCTGTLPVGTPEYRQMHGQMQNLRPPALVLVRPGGLSFARGGLTFCTRPDDETDYYKTRGRSPMSLGARVHPLAGYRCLLRILQQVVTTVTTSRAK